MYICIYAHDCSFRQVRGININDIDLFYEMLVSTSEDTTIINTTSNNNDNTIHNDSTNHTDNNISNAAATTTTTTTTTNDNDNDNNADKHLIIEDESVSLNTLVNACMRLKGPATT